MNNAAPVRQTSVRRQPRPADPDLAGMDRRIAALEREDCQTATQLRLRWQHLDRDKASRLAGWYGDASALALAIERAEGMA